MVQNKYQQDLCLNCHWWWTTTIPPNWPAGITPCPGTSTRSEGNHKARTVQKDGPCGREVQLETHLICKKERRGNYETHGLFSHGKRKIMYSADWGLLTCNLLKQLSLRALNAEEFELPKSIQIDNSCNQHIVLSTIYKYMQIYTCIHDVFMMYICATCVYIYI